LDGFVTGRGLLGNGCPDPHPVKALSKTLIGPPTSAGPARAVIVASCLGKSSERLRVVSHCDLLAGLPFGSALSASALSRR